MDVDTTALGSTGRLSEADGGGTTALLVCVVGTGLLALDGLLAGRSVRHVEVSLDVSVVVGRDLHALDGEALAVAAERRTVVLVDAAGDALAATESLGAGALGVRVVLALEAGELVSTVVTDVSVGSEVLKVVTALLLVVTGVVPVGG